MKYLLVILVLVVAWMMGSRGRGNAAPPPPTRRHRTGDGAAREQMLACAHCGVHLPQSEAVNDAAGRPYCGEAHRLAGPRGPA